jgi:hypothetical protein
MIDFKSKNKELGPLFLNINEWYQNHLFIGKNFNEKPFYFDSQSTG